MKKYASVLFVLLLAVVISGCGSDSPTGNVILGESLLCGAEATPEEQDICLFLHGKNGHDIGICSKINDFDLRRSCYHQALSAIDYNVDCEEVEDLVIRDTCYSTQAKSERNIDKCEYVISKDKQFDCHVAVARKLNLLDLCSRAIEERQQDCIRHIVRKNSCESGDCEPISDAELKQFCQSEVESLE